MNWVEDTIRDFGRGMGVENLSFNNEGFLCLDIETLGSLFIERIEEAVIVYLAREIPQHVTGILGKALALCHYREGLPFAVNAAFREENLLIFSVRLSENEVSLPVLERAVDLIMEQHRKVKEEKF